MVPGHKCVSINLIGCGFDPYWRKLDIFISILFGKQWETECLNTSFPLDLIQISFRVDVRGIQQKIYISIDFDYIHRLK